MTARRGQVALYLLMVLVAIAVLVFANVNVFLAVRSKNRMMNAVDAAALAAAKRQGALLNELGRMNVEHLRSLILGEPWERMGEMRELAMFGPLTALTDACRAAAEWGGSDSVSSEAAACLRQHAAEIANEYCASPEFYPQYRENQWADYAAELSALANGALTVVPGYMETANAWSQEPLLAQAFYDAIAARAWCWFGFGTRRRFFDMDSKTMARPEFNAVTACENSEVFSLHVTFKTWQDSPWGGVFDARWTNFVCQVTGCSPDQVARSSRVSDPNELWLFYDDNWGRWSRTFNPTDFPIAGSVRPEYDVAGCVASCLMVGDIVQIKDEDETINASRRMCVTAEAKPLGTVDVPGFGRSPVTGFSSFVAPSYPGAKIFQEAQLVLVGSVPRAPGVSLEPTWYAHVKEHLPQYFACGPLVNGCYFCRQLQVWENPTFRGQAREWLDRNQTSCRSTGGEGGGRGGYDYAH